RFVSAVRRVPLAAQFAHPADNHFLSVAAAAEHEVAILVIDGTSCVQSQVRLITKAAPAQLNVFIKQHATDFLVSRIKTPVVIAVQNGDQPVGGAKPATIRAAGADQHRRLADALGASVHDQPDNFVTAGSEPAARDQSV